jgi:hypothetical protein
MAESVAGECRWIDVDKGTFVQFAQFAYTGDYSIPSCSIAQAVGEAESDDVVYLIPGARSRTRQGTHPNM